MGQRGGQDSEVSPGLVEVSQTFSLGPSPVETSVYILSALWPGSVPPCPWQIQRDTLSIPRVQCSFLAGAPFPLVGAAGPVPIFLSRSKLDKVFQAFEGKQDHGSVSTALYCGCEPPHTGTELTTGVTFILQSLRVLDLAGQKPVCVGLGEYP